MEVEKGVVVADADSEDDETGFVDAGETLLEEADSMTELEEADAVAELKEVDEMAELREVD